MKKNCLLLLLALLPLSATAEDWGVGLEAEIEKKLSKKLELGINAEYRTQDGVYEHERWSLGGGIDYKINKWLKYDLGYALINKHALEETTNKYRQCDYWRPNHRIYTSLTLSVKLLKHFDLSLRERYQYNYATGVNIERYELTNPDKRASDKVKEGKNEHLLRSRAQCKLIIKKKCPWVPFVSIESLNDLSRGFASDQMRYTAGLEYKATKHTQLGASYRYKDKAGSDEAAGHLISISYNYAF